MTTKYDIFTRKQLQADRCICLAAKRTGKPYEGKPHVRFDEKMLEIGYGCNSVTLSEETERNGEYKYQPVATTPAFYSTGSQERDHTLISEYMFGNKIGFCCHACHNKTIAHRI